MVKECKRCGKEFTPRDRVLINYCSKTCKYTRGDEHKHRGYRFVDRTGQRFGFVVITGLSDERYINPSGKEYYKWNYLCDCGNVGSIETSNLIRKRKKHKFSCGCNMGGYRETLLLNQAGLNVCHRCKKTLPLDHFGKNAGCKNGLQRSCRKCKSKRDNQYRNDPRYRPRNLERKKEWGKKWREENPDKYLEYLEHRRNSRDYSAEYQRMMNDPLLRCKDSIRKLLLSSLKVRGIKKSKIIKSTEDLLCCDYLFFKSHMEEQFEEGMDWLNHGEWHIDHKVPLNEGKTVDEIIKLNHYSNLQPLWSSDNLSKSFKTDPKYNDLCIKLIGRDISNEDNK